ncbi:Histidine phosphatase superfamily [Propionibacterium ruminifibrarum]|uniref:Histidine phosphatase superfamily n=1 Tax=Propionibacterium ruminifibrarum TaxID=1962131 RepID=A0A375I2V4_9ACTN|nr:histidine phosphatase family protein [Propionibacterium ruminifibrarum]SPF67552.1 Histidine phosphatase superfamily [Propionibacterium ruminifibrarum]
MIDPGTRLILWRHGRTGFNVRHLFQGQQDVPLDEVGVAQARAAAPYLAGMNPDRIVSSPLSRARNTAAALSVLTGLPVEKDDRLTEVDVGDWAGLTLDQVGITRGHGPDPWSEDEDFRFSPTGETNAEVRERVGRALREIAWRHQGLTTVVVSHWVAIREGVQALCGPGFRTGEHPAPGNCSWTVLEPAGDDWQVRIWGARPGR